MSFINKEILKAQPEKLFRQNGQPYVGYYYLENNIPISYSPSSRIGEKLLSYTEVNFLRIKNRINVKGGYRVPMGTRPVPTIYDYGTKYIERYFVQKRNSPLNSIIEIDRDQFNEITSQENRSAINLNIYNNTSLSWMISGPIELVYATNIKKLDDLEETFPGLKSFLRDPLQFYKPVESHL
jgi:hypothetical protein